MDKDEEFRQLRHRLHLVVEELSAIADELVDFAEKTQLRPYDEDEDEDTRPDKPTM